MHLITKPNKKLSILKALSVYQIVIFYRIFYQNVV